VESREIVVRGIALSHAFLLSFEDGGVLLLGILIEFLVRAVYFVDDDLRE
jgi:hypothetical protein